MNINNIVYVYMFWVTFVVNTTAQDSTQTSQPPKGVIVSPDVRVPTVYTPPKTNYKNNNQKQLVALADASATGFIKQITPSDLEMRSNENGNVFAIGVVGSDNPFALGISYNSIDDPAGNNISTVEPVIRKPLIEFPDEPVTVEGPAAGGWLFYILFAILGYFVVLISVYRTEIIKMLAAFSNINMAQQAYRDQKSFIAATDFFTYILFFMSAGSFIFLFIKFLGASLPYAPLMSLFACMGGVAVVYLLKHLQLFVLSLIFPFKNEISVYSFIIGNSNKVMGIVLVPLVFLSAYVPTVLQSSFLWFTLVIIALSYLYRSFRGVLLSSNYLMHNKFHFLLYLYAVEIAPVILLVKLMINGV